MLDHATHRGLDAGRIEGRKQVEQVLPDRLRGGLAEELRGAPAPDGDATARVAGEQGPIGRVEVGADEIIELFEVFGPAADLLVEGGEILVGALQLLVEGFERLVVLFSMRASDPHASPRWFHELQELLERHATYVEERMLVELARGRGEEFLIALGKEYASAKLAMLDTVPPLASPSTIGAITAPPDDAARPVPPAMANGSGAPTTGRRT